MKTIIAIIILCSLSFYAGYSHRINVSDRMLDSFRDDLVYLTFVRYAEREDEMDSEKRQHMIELFSQLKPGDYEKTLILLDSLNRML